MLTTPDARLVATAPEGAYVLLEVAAPAGTTTPAHRLTREQLVVVVLEGVLLAELADELRTVAAGEVLVLAPGEPRRLAVRVALRAVVLLTPGGAEALLDLASAPPQHPDDVAARLTAAEIVVLSPAWSGGGGDRSRRAA